MLLSRCVTSASVFAHRNHTLPVSAYVLYLEKLCTLYRPYVSFIYVECWLIFIAYEVELLQIVGNNKLTYLLIT